MSRPIAKPKKKPPIDAWRKSLPDRNARFELYLKSCCEGLGLLKAESVDIIITDPPYAEEYLPVYEDLGRLAAHALKPGGLALVMTGQSYLLQVGATLSAHLDYHWTLTYLTPGGQAVQQFPRTVNIFWKPVLLYRKGEWRPNWFGDVVKSAVNDNDKQHHEWGQSVSGMQDLMRRFVRPGATVLDPFLGGGTTALVALELGAYFIGFDTDAQAITTTKARIVSDAHATARLLEAINHAPLPA